MKKEKSLTSEDARLGDLILPDKKKVAKTLSKLRRDVKPCEMSDLLLKPLYEITGMMIKGRK